MSDAAYILPSKTVENVWAPLAIQELPNPDLEFIPLTIGDPSYGGLLHPPEFIEDTIFNNIKSKKFNGYDGPGYGYSPAREAIAKKANAYGSHVTAEDVVITCGCSQALDMVFTSITTANDEYIFLPRPSFFLYKSICSARQLKFLYYDLNPMEEWNIDFEDLDSKLQQYNCKLLVINNPMNPTGSVYSLEHLKKFLFIAEKYSVNVLSDEVYNNLTWGGKTYIPLASLKSTVPIIEVNSLSKQFMSPGWRVGWAIFHGANNIFDQVKKVMKSINLTEGPPLIFQSIVPELLSNTQDNYYEQNSLMMEKHQNIVFRGLNDCPAITYIPSYGAMYTMPKVDLDHLDIDSTNEFCQKLMTEQSVSVLPGETFELAGYIRIVLVQSPHNLEVACSRIKQFCQEHTIHTNQ